VRSIAVIASIVLAACGASGTARSTSPSPPPGSGSARGRPASAGYSPEAICRRLFEVTAQCGLKSMDQAEMSRCVQEFKQAASEAGDPGSLDIPFTRCLVEHTECGAIADCMTTIDGESKLRACHDVDQRGQRVAIPRPAWEQRRGAAVTTFRNARSTQERPNEMCGIPEATLWLTTLRCEDGSQPLKNSAEAEDARPGNVGPGGRCGSYIDRYVVPCPEASYEIFIDAYICPAPE
jgi:hypothetical protein